MNGRSLHWWKTQTGGSPLAIKLKRDNSQTKSAQQRKDASASHIPTHDQIKRRAHEIYLERGASPGNELDDWLRAERELERIALYTRSWNRLSILDGRQVLKFEDDHNGKVGIVSKNRGDGVQRLDSASD